MPAFGTCLMHGVNKVLTDAEAICRIVEVDAGVAGFEGFFSMVKPSSNLKAFSKYLPLCFLLGNCLSKTVLTSKSPGGLVKTLQGSHPGFLIKWVLGWGWWGG